MPSWFCTIHICKSALLSDSWPWNVRAPSTKRRLDALLLLLPLVLARLQERWAAAAQKRSLGKFVIKILGRFRKHNVTPNRDVTCLGMAWARLPVNREVAGAWSSRPKIVVFWRTKRSALLLRAFNAMFSPISLQAACSAQLSSVNDDVSRRDLTSRCVF